MQENQLLGVVQHISLVNNDLSLLFLFLFNSGFDFIPQFLDKIYSQLLINLVADFVRKFYTFLVVVVGHGDAVH